MSDRIVLIITRVFLVVIGVVFVVSGTFAFIDPVSMVDWLGLTPTGPAGEAEIRAMYGGLVIGSGLLVLIGLVNRLLEVAALAATFFGAGGLVSTRIVIQAMEGFTVNQGIIATFEFSMVVFSLLLLRASMRRASPQTE